MGSRFANDYHVVYFIFVALYYVLLVGFSKNNFEYQILEMIVKCGSVGILWYAVDEKVKDLQKDSIPCHGLKRFRTGVIFSILGDALLVWDDSRISVFIAGLVSFLISHLLYISSFGFKPLKLKLAAPLFVAAVLTTASVSYAERLLQHRMDDHLFILITMSCGVYSCILYLGIWRTTVLVTQANEKMDRRKAKLALTGYITYLFSDWLLAFNKFVLKDDKYAWVVFMLAYFAAQFLLVEALLLDASKIRSAASVKKTL